MLQQWYFHAIILVTEPELVLRLTPKVGSFPYRGVRVNPTVNPTTNTKRTSCGLGFCVGCGVNTNPTVGVVNPKVGL